MNTTLVLLLVACMVACISAQYGAAGVDAYDGDINNDGIPNYKDVNFDGKEDAYAGFLNGRYRPAYYAHHGYYGHPAVHPGVVY